MSQTVSPKCVKFDVRYWTCFCLSDYKVSKPKADEECWAKIGSNSHLVVIDSQEKYQAIVDNVDNADRQW